MERKPISKGLRHKILARDNYRCRYCGATPQNNVLLHVDHILPVVEGGTNDESNLATACVPCNIGKGVKRLDQVIPAPSLEDERERLEQMRAWTELQRSLMQERDSLMDELAVAWEERTHGRLPRDFDRHMRKPLAELGAAKLVEVFDIVGQRGLRGTAALRYFYGILRNQRAEAKGPVKAALTEEPRPALSPWARLVMERMRAAQARLKASGHHNINMVIAAFQRAAYARPGDGTYDYDDGDLPIATRGLLFCTKKQESGMISWWVEDDPDWSLEDDADGEMNSAGLDVEFALMREESLEAAKVAWEQLCRVIHEGRLFKRFLRNQPTRTDETAEETLRKYRQEIGWPNPELT